MTAPPQLSDQSLALAAIFSLLVPLALAGLALISTGLGRSRSAAHSMISAMAAIAVAAIVYCLWGFGLHGDTVLPSHAVTIGGRSWDWIGAGPFGMRGLLKLGDRLPLVALLQILSVAFAALIPLSSAMDRWRLSAICASTLLLAGFTYPLFAHWAQGHGWLAQLGAQYGFGRGFLDGGGVGSIQVLGGVTALSLVWILGPRRGKYSHDGMPAAIPGHNIVLVALGCLLSWLGWIGLNAAIAVLFAGATGAQAGLIAINLTVAAGSSALASLLTTRTRFGRPDASLAANAWIGGLVAGSAGASLFPPLAAILVGAVAGVLVTYSADRLEFWLAIDDGGGAISAHAVAGFWGLLAVAAFGQGQWLAQLVGIATLLGFVLPVTYGLNWALDRVWRQRVEVDGERQGLDLYELGSGAYPEFAVHSDEFIQR
jgi:Amt family ammonium transporter